MVKYMICYHLVKVYMYIYILINIKKLKNMKVNTDLESLRSPGVYIIENTISKKFYVGSTTQSTFSRLKRHMLELRSNKHRNSHLQNSWNKYTEGDWEIRILETCNSGIESIRSREQYWIDKLDAVGKGYNLNPNASKLPGRDFMKESWKRKGLQPITENDNIVSDVDGDFEKIDPFIIRETKIGKGDERKVLNKAGVAGAYWKKIKNDEISIDDVPVEYHKLIEKYKARTPWNKNKKYDSTDHLKVPKKNKGDRSKDRETKRIKLPNVIVVDNKGCVLGEWRSSKDLEEESFDDNFALIPHMTIKNKNGRNGYPAHVLKTFNINKSVKTGKPYKGLHFKFKY